MASEWTRESLLELAAGRRLFVRGPDGTQLPAPAWLAEVAEEDSPLDSAQSVDATHPDDRNALIEAFIAAVEAPGVPISGHIRVDRDGVWLHSDMIWLNLLGHPDVDAIICVAWEVDGPEFEVPERQVAGTMAATNWMIVGLDASGRVESVRGRLEQMLGYTEEEIRGVVLTEFIHADCKADAIENWISLKEHREQTRTSRWVWRRKDGSDVWLESSYLVHDDGAVEVVVVDVSDQVASELALAESQREVAQLAEDFRLLADEVPTAVFRCDDTGRVLFRNGQWSESFESAGEVVRVQDLIHASERHAFDELLDRLRAGDASDTTIEVRADAGVRVLEIRCRPTSGDQLRFVGSITDVTARATFRHQALHDPLTGLANRTMIEATLAEAIRSDPTGTLVVFIDLDGFKAVNDDHGHDAGDAVLVELGQRLSRAVRPGDSVARYGGDEFVVVCRGVGADAECQVIDRLRGVFGPVIHLDGWSWAPGASLGVARPDTDADAATVLRRADQAMFEEKRTRQSPHSPVNGR